MSISGRIPNQIEELLVTNRRGFLRSAGLLAVSFGRFGVAGLTEADAQSAAAQGRAPIPIPISTRSTRGS